MSLKYEKRKLIKEVDKELRNSSFVKETLKKRFEEKHGRIVRTMIAKKETSHNGLT